MTTKITTDNIASETLTTILGPKVSSIVYPSDDTAANTAGGDSITLLGSGFNNGASVIVNGTSAGVVTVVSSTQITFIAPAQTAGTYVIYVINSDGGTAIVIPGISYSGTPTWSTSAGNIGVGYETGSISTTVTASGDAPITYSVVSGTLPTGSSLNTSSGLISGTASATASSTTYSFTIKATDPQNQDTNRAFSITINPDVVTWSSPANSTTYEVFTNSAIANVAMSATSASGGSITYTADTLPTGLSITGANIAGTPTVAASTSTTLTATSTSTRSATRTINWVVSIANDTYFKNTTLLLNGETTVTPFISDASTNSFGLTIVGDTKPVLFNPYTPGYYSNYFDGTGDYLATPASSILDVGNTSWTIECWVYMNNTTGTQMIVGYNNTSSSDFWDLTVVSGVPTFKRRIASSEVVVSGGTVSANIFTHVAVVRNGTAVTIYLNGSSVATNASVSMPTSMSDQILGIGANRYGNGYEYYFNGFISNLRIVKGTAVYTSAFTPPTTPLTAIANTSLLTCQSNRFIDNSTNALTITKVGDTTVSPAIPFTANSSYSTYGSTYFPTTNTGADNLTIASNSALSFTAANNFTVESWIYLTTQNTYSYICSKGNGASREWAFAVASSSMLFYWSTNGSADSTVTASFTFQLNTWYHVAMSKSDTSVRLFVNGTQQGSTGTFTTIYNGSSPFRIATFMDYTGISHCFAGYISNLRIVKGTAVYTSTFTPSTTPLTAVANTSLLTLQYNGGATNQAIIDNSTFNNIITRNGNTSQGSFSPYSVTGWSNYFDGTGDYLRVPYNAGFAMSSSNFTIEYWVYPTVLSGDITVLGAHTNDGNGGYGVGFDGTTPRTWINFGSGWPQVTGPSALLNAWNHIALVRNGSSFYMYTNGVPGTVYTNAAPVVNASNSDVTIGARYDGTGNFYTGYVSNARIVKGTALYTTTFTPSTTPLTTITNTQLLTCQSNRLIDNSPNSSTLTRNGDVSVQAFGPFGSVPEAVPISYSNYFDGTGDYLTVPSNANFTFPADFTIECWIYVPSISRTIQRIFSSNAGPSGACYFSVGNDIGTGAGAGKLCANGHLVSPYTAGFITASTAIPINTWIHAALVRSGSTITIYQDGVSVASATDSATWDFNNSAGVRISGAIWAGSSEDFGGYISNVRVVKGTAVYTTTFTPSTTPLTAIANTSLLTCQSTRMIDNSTNAFTITASGDTKPRIFNPFGYTAQSATSYTPSIHGGSAYFDGTGDGLVVPSNSGFQFGSGNFTIECWVYLNAYGTTGSVFLGPWGNTSGSNRGWVFGYINTGTSFLFTYSTTGTDSIGVSGTYPLALKTWYHLAAVRNGNSITVYSNGILVGTASTSATLYTNTTNLYIGQNTEDGVLPTTSNNFSVNGHISDVRIVKGFAIYTSNFVPPTAPLTNYSTNIPAQLLLNFNNGGIIDQHGSNVLETLGNAQLSTAVKKYGNASMYFDGTGDYLISSPNAAVLNAFGTGDFTVEFWMNSISFANADNIKIIFDCRPLSTDGLYPCIYFSSGQIRYFVNNVDRITGSTLNTGQWYHVALTRSGSSTKLFVDGTQVGSTYTDTNNYLCGANRPIIASRGHTLGDNNYNGYIDDLRITKGVARYTTTFTPPTSALITK